MAHENREILSSLVHPALDEGAFSLLVCSENNFMATDNLRSALTDLNKAYALIEQLLDEVRRHSATPSKES